VLLFFSNRLPSLARSLGQSITEFKRGFREIEDQSNKDKSEEVTVEQHCMEVQTSAARPAGENFYDGT
jgi:Sec-independent protein translocase protein TatA